MADHTMPARVGRRMDAMVASRPHDTGASNNESYCKRFELYGASDLEIETAALRQARARQAGSFLKGPIPMRDIAAAARLRGPGLAVFLAVHHRVAITRTNTVTLPRNLMLELGISRDGKARAIHHLENAGLVRVERRSGRTCRISLNPNNSRRKGDYYE